MLLIALYPKQTFKIIMLTTFLGLTSCTNSMTASSLNGGLSTGPGGSKDPGNPQNPSNPSNPSNPGTDQWQKAKAESTGFSALPTGQQKVIGVDQVNKMFIIALPMTNTLPVPSGLEVEIPELPGSKIVSSAQADNSVALELHIPIKYLTKYIGLGDPAKLPSGDPLPQVPGGELPKIAVDFPIKDVRIYLYLGVEALALFVEAFDPKIKLTFPIKTAKEDGSRERTLGYISTVPAKKPYQGGVFLSFLLPEDLSRMLDELL